MSDESTPAEVAAELRRVPVLFQGRAIAAHRAGRLMPTLRHERMNDVFEKWHVEGLPFPCAFHHFTGPDRGDPHDHPWGFTSHVLTGGYVEEIANRNGGLMLVERLPGTSHSVAATHIHRIVSLPAGECWTLVMAGPWERTSRFWRFDEAGAWSRPWDQPEFERIAA